MPITLRQLADHVCSYGADAVTLFAPDIRYRSLNTSQFGPCMDWRAELSMGQFDFDDTLSVLVGAVDFLTIRLGEELVGGNILDSLSSDAENFAVLFDGRWVSDAVQDQFDAMPIDSVLIVLSVFLAEPVRHHDLGAWMVSEIVYRMLPTNNGLVLMFPYPTDGDEEVTAATAAAAEKLGLHWRKVGLDPLIGAGGFLGQSTAYTALGKAREMLAPVGQVSIPVTAAELARYRQLRLSTIDD